MKLFAVLRVPLLLLGAFAAVAADTCARPSLPKPRTLASETVAAPPPAAASLSVPDLLDRVTPAVVSIYSLRSVHPGPTLLHSGEDGLQQPQNLGSGVIVRSEGVILTNQHVVETAEEVKVVLWDRREFLARVVGVDPHTDIALLRIDAGPLPEATMGDSAALRIGEPVLAIGNALGLGQTVSSGIIGARGRTKIGIVDEEDFLQVDASMNPGSSGGPLINLKGEVIGINTAIASRSGGFQGIGFVIPSRLVGEVMEHLLRDGRIRRGELGASLQDLTPALAEAFLTDVTRGAIVTEVAPGGAADRAGLRRSDVILALEGKAVKSSSDLEHRIAMAGAGASVRFAVWREGKPLSLKGELTELAETPVDRHETAIVEDPEGKPSGLEGVRVRAVTQDMLREVGIQDEEGGLIVTAVRRAGIFAGLRRGDLIVEVNHQAVRDADEVLSALCLQGQSVLLRVRRAEGSFYIMLPGQ